MPIYEFHCEKCGEDSEVLVPSSDWKGTACPKCGSKKLIKKLSVFSASAGSEGADPACDGNPSTCCSCPHRHMH